MATDSPSTGDTIKIFYEGEYHELIVRVRQSHPECKAETLAQLTTKTIGLWLRVWQAYKHDIWSLDGMSPETVLEMPSGDFEPFVTVFNKTFTGISITVHSSSRTQAVLNTLMAVIFARDDIAMKMPQLFEGQAKQAPTSPTQPAPAPKPASPDKNDVDAWLKDESDKSGKKANIFVRPAIAGTLQGTLKLEKGGKDKHTWETAIIANKPYSHNEVQYQEKDLVVYPILGAIRYDADSSGYFFSIPVDSASIRIYQREATNHNGSLIESDSQKLIKHLGITGELTQGMSWQVPATHIAMKIGKTGEKGQFKNYAGLYALS